MCKHLFASLFMLFCCLHAFWLFIFCITVKNKHKQEMKKQQSEYEADARLTKQKHKKKIIHWKAELLEVKLKLMTVG